MKIRSAISAAVITIGATMAGLAAATPAQAARSSFDQMWRGDNHYQAWVDNSNRSVRLKSVEGGYGFHVDFYEYDTAGNMYKLYVDAHKDWTWYLPRPVSAWRLCGPNTWGGDDCTRWHSLDR